MRYLGKEISLNALFLKTYEEKYGGAYAEAINIVRKTHMKPNDPMQTQRDEFEALHKMIEQKRRLDMTAVVEDDYPVIRRGFEVALHDYVKAMKANGRFDKGNKFGLAILPDWAKDVPEQLAEAEANKAALIKIHDAMILMGGLGQAVYTKDVLDILPDWVRGRKPVVDEVDHPFAPRKSQVEPHDCWFCRSVLRDTFHYNGKDEEWNVVCFSCGAEGPTRENPDEAIEAWNVIEEGGLHSDAARNVLKHVKALACLMSAKFYPNKTFYTHGTIRDNLHQIEKMLSDPLIGKQSTQVQHDATEWALTGLVLKACKTSMESSGIAVPWALDTFISLAEERAKG